MCRKTLETVSENRASENRVSDTVSHRKSSEQFDRKMVFFRQEGWVIANKLIPGTECYFVFFTFLRIILHFFFFLFFFSRRETRLRFKIQHEKETKKQGTRTGACHVLRTKYVVP